MNEDERVVACCPESGEMLQVCFDLALSRAFMNPVLALIIMGDWHQRHMPPWLITVRPREVT